MDISASSGILLNMYNRVKDICPEEEPVITIETNQ